MKPSPTVALLATLLVACGATPSRITQDSQVPDPQGRWRGTMTQSGKSFTAYLNFGHSSGSMGDFSGYLELPSAGSGTIPLDGSVVSGRFSSEGVGWGLYFDGAFSKANWVGTFQYFDNGNRTTGTAKFTKL